MCDLIEVECVKAECDLLAACRQSLAHGALLATRYILAEIDFNAGCKEGRAGQTELKVRIVCFFQGSSPRDPCSVTTKVRTFASRRRRRNPGSLY